MCNNIAHILSKCAKRQIPAISIFIYTKPPPPSHLVNQNTLQQNPTLLKKTNPPEHTNRNILPKLNKNQIATTNPLNIFLCPYVLMSKKTNMSKETCV